MISSLLCHEPSGNLGKPRDDILTEKCFYVPEIKYLI